MRTLRYPDSLRAQLGMDHPGPWQAEDVDRADWIDADTDLDCMVLRGPGGAWCGYVGLPPGHRFHGSGWDDPDVRVHGGLTFANSCQESEDPNAICHVPQPGRPAEVWWLGFDCSHALDRSPRMEALAPGFMYLQEYRTFEYVKQETEALAKQLHS